MGSLLHALRAEKLHLDAELAELRREEAALLAGLPAVEAKAPGAPADDEPYRVLFEHAVEAIAVFRIEDSQVIAANPAATALTGYSLEELLGMTARSLVGRPVGGAPPPYIGRMFAEGWADGEDVIVGKGGVRIPVEIRMGLVDFDDGRAAVFFVRDVSDQRRLEAQVREVFEQAPDGIVFMDEARRFTAVNPAACALVGLAQGEILGRTLDDFVGGGDLRRLAAARQALPVDGAADVGEWEVRRRDGSTVAIEVRVAVVNGRARHAFLRDVTARRRLEAEREEALRALGAGEERYRAIFEDAAEPILAFRVEGDRRGTIAAANGALAALTGYTREELRHMAVHDLTRPPPSAGMPARMAGLMVDGASVSETVLATKGGSDVPVVFRTALAQLGGERVALAVGHDVTERKRAEEALRASEERYRLMFENASESIFVAALEGERAGMILAANPAAAILTGYTVPELRSRTLGSLAAPEALPRFARLHARLRATGRDGGEMSIVTRTGATVPIWFENRLTRIEGEAVALVFAHDASAQREVEAALREAKEAAESANRAKSAFLANMSHEIRTPLNAILGYVQLLQRDPALTDEQRRALRIIDRSGDHLLEMINEVLEMSKIEAGHRRVQSAPFDLGAMIADVRGTFEARAREKQLGFAVDVAPGVPRRLIADEGKLHQVLVNLLSNAVRLTREGGVTVRIGVERADRLAVEVEDTGPGISAADHPRIFRPFEHALGGAGARGGTGLGLALSRELCQLMGGEISVESRVGSGSVFRFTVPFTRPPAGAEGEETLVAESAGREVEAPRRPSAPAQPAPRLPPELVAPLRRAAHIADHDAFSRLLDALAPRYPATTGELRALLEVFAYDRIEELLAS